MRRTTTVLFNGDGFAMSVEFTDSPASRSELFHCIHIVREASIQF